MSRGKEYCPPIPVPSTSKSRPFSWDTVKDRSSVGALILAPIVDEGAPVGGVKWGIGGSDGGVGDGRVGGGAGGGAGGGGEAGGGGGRVGGGEVGGGVGGEVGGGVGGVGGGGVGGRSDSTGAGGRWAATFRRCGFPLRCSSSAPSVTGQPQGSQRVIS